MQSYSVTSIVRLERPFSRMDVTGHLKWCRWTETRNISRSWEYRSALRMPGAMATQTSAQTITFSLKKKHRKQKIEDIDVSTESDVTGIRFLVVRAMPKLTTSLERTRKLVTVHVQHEKKPVNCKLSVAAEWKVRRSFRVRYIHKVPKKFIPLPYKCHDWKCLKWFRMITRKRKVWRKWNLIHRLF